MDASEIEVRLGANWVKPEYITQFMKEVFKTPNYYAGIDIKATYSEISGAWNISGKSLDRGNPLVTNTYGTLRVNAYKLLEDALNLRDTKIYDTIHDADGDHLSLIHIFVSRGMCVDFVIHDTNSGNPHCHIMLTMRPLDERGAWAAKSKKEYDLDENGERIRLPSGRYKTHKVDLTGWNSQENALVWRKAWADISNDYLERAGSPERIDHRSNAERGIDEIPTVHMGVAACQMEKKGIATEKGELNRNIQKTNRLIREIRAQIGKLKEWIADLFKAWETAPKQPPQSPNLANLLMKYLSVQREKSRKYSQRWQQQHTADELKTIAAAVNYLSEHGISNLDELDASLSSVSDKAYSIRAGMKTAEERMKKLQKLIEYGKNYTEYKPIHDELKKLQNGWTNKRDKYEEAHRAELTLWNAASRYLHANLPKGTKTLPIAEWEQEYADLKTQRDSDYTKLKDTRTNVSELQKIRKCVDIALRADQPEQTQSRTKRHEQER